MYFFGLHLQNTVKPSVSQGLYATFFDFYPSELLINIGCETSVDYKKLYTSNEEFPDNWIFWGFIREDSTKKVWLRRITDDEEVLLYDFTLAAGDSIKLGYDLLYYYVDSITTEVINDAPRKKYWISYEEYDWQDTWIEGIGSNRGILSSGSAGVVGGWDWALCMWEAEELIYMNPSFNACYLITGINEFENPIFQIYPNPTKNFITIKNPQIRPIKSITLIDMNGHIVKHFNSVKTTLNISDINPGVYLLEISFGAGVVTKKIVIE